MLMLTGFPELHFNRRTISQDSRPLQNGTGSHFGVKQVVVYGQKCSIPLFSAEIQCAEGGTIVNRYLAPTILVIFRDAPIPIPGIGIGWIGAKKGVSVSVVESEYWYRWYR